MRKPWFIPQRLVAERKQTSIIPWKETRKILFFLLCSSHSFDTEVNVFFPHTALFNKSVPVVLWPRGRFFQSHQHSQSWLLLSWEHLSSSSLDLHLSVSSESLQPVFMPTVLWPLLFLTAPFSRKPALCFFYRRTSCACFSSHRYCWESFASRWLVKAGFLEKCCVWCWMARLN